MISKVIHELRDWVMGDLTQVTGEVGRVLHGQGAPELSWHGERFWVDRIRRVVLVQSATARVEASAWLSPDTLPEADAEAEELLDVYGGESFSIDGGSLLRMWARQVAGKLEGPMWSAEGAKLLTLLVTQPMCNPAFEPLMWLALAQDVGPMGDPSDDLMMVLRPMMYLPRYYPALVPEPRAVREAQVAFLEQVAPGVTSAGDVTISADDWHRTCEGERERRWKWIEETVFAELARRTGGAPS